MLGMYVLTQQDLHDMLKAKYRIIRHMLPIVFQKKGKNEKTYLYLVCKYINIHWKAEKETNKAT